MSMEETDDNVKVQRGCFNNFRFFPDMLDNTLFPS